MNRATHQQTKFWLLPQFDGLEMFRAKAIHYHYARHFHSSYSIGVIEAGIGGNDYQGATYLAPPKSIVLMNPEEAHTGFSAEGLPLTYRMLYSSVDCMHKVANELQMSGTPYFKDAVIQDDGLAKSILSLHALLEQSQDQLAQETLFVEVLSAILNRYTNIKTNLARCHQEHRAVQLMKDYFHENFKSTISLEQLVALTNLNRSYLIEFAAALNEVNAIADHSPGFVWRLQTASGNATDIRAYPDPKMLVNVSVWQSVEQLKAYVYKSLHGQFFVRRRQWFEKYQGEHFAMWWIPAGHLPTVEEGKAKLEYLTEWLSVKSST